MNENLSTSRKHKVFRCRRMQKITITCAVLLNERGLTQRQRHVIESSSHSFHFRIWEAPRVHVRSCLSLCPERKVIAYLSLATLCPLRRA